MSLPPRAGAYVHVPYCAHRCSYCSFVAVTSRDTEEAYFESLEREAALRANEVPGPLDTVYFGGGTPSYVAPARLGRLLERLRGVWGIAGGAEVTAEANPDDLDGAALEALAAAGVGRVSLGVQSLNDAELVPLERRHDAAAARRALRAAAERFPRVSADLMIGVPGQTMGSLLASLEGVIAAGARHVSVYLLELEKAPRLVALQREAPELFPDDEEMAARWEAVDDACAAAGLPRYEVSNWAAPGHESRHNLKYWTLAPTVGLGAAAHSWDGRTRRANSGSIAEYLRCLGEGRTAVVAAEPIEGEAFERERVLLGLRLGDGVAADAFDAVRACRPREARERLGDAFEAGLLERAGERVLLTRRGVLLSNEVFSLLV